MEFSHPCFQRGHPYLLEYIKWKIAHSKTEEKVGGLKVEAVNHVLNEVKTMRDQQNQMDSRLSSINQENEALWREVAILRQKHMKQQQIMNKLIQLLVTIVQPQRSGLGAMNKRHSQLMIDDTPESSKVSIVVLWVGKERPAVH
jgi:heat shock transcription factor 1